jgi:hypothetical protein
MSIPISQSISVQILQEWCQTNNFDAYQTQGLRPAHFEYGVRGIQAVPSTSTITNGEYHPLVFEDAFVQSHTNLNPLEQSITNILPTYHSTRNNLQFTTNHVDLGSQHTNFNFSPTPTNFTNSALESHGCYSYRDNLLHSTINHATNTTNDHNPNNFNIYDPNDQNDGIKQFSPIIQIPYHLMISPLRFLYSNPLLLELIVDIHSVQLNQDFTSFIHSETFSATTINHSPSKKIEAEHK